MKQPAANIPAESAVIAGLWQSKDPVDDILKLQITPELFANDNRRRLFVGIVDSLEKGDSLTLSSMAERVSDECLVTLEACLAGTVSAAALPDDTARLQRAYAERHKNNLLIELGKAAKAGNLVLIDDLHRKLHDIEKPAKQQGISGQALMLKNFIEPPMLLSDFFPATGLYLLVGKQKLGKSWFALQLALTKAQGGTFLDRQLSHGRVLYLALEDNQRRMKSRIAKLQPELIDNPVALASIEFFHIDDCVPRLGNGFEAWLDARIKGRSLVIIDVLAKIRPARRSGSNGYQDDYGDIGGLQRLALKHEVCIVLLHHTRKAESDDPFDAILGTGGIGGAADGTVLLQRKRGDGSTIATVTGRDVEEGEFGLTFKAGAWRFAGTAADIRETAERQAIIGLLRDAGTAGLTAKTLAETLGKNEPNIRFLLRKLEKNGRIIRVDTKPAPHYKPAAENDDDE